MYAGVEMQLYISLTSTAERMQVISFNSRPIYNRCFGDREGSASQMRSGHCREENMSVLQTEIELKFPGRPAHVFVHSSRLPRLPFTLLPV